jgi:hypothetical protein
MDPYLFIAALQQPAMDSMKESGILASITIAQAALETGWGESVPYNNLFGIKGAGSTHETSEYVNGQWIRIQDNFRVYDSWEDSVADHGSFLSSSFRYSAVVGETNFRIAAQELLKAGYATDPQYAQKLINIIERWNLDRFDWIVLNNEVEAAGTGDEGEIVTGEDGEETASPEQYVMSAKDADTIIAFLSAAYYCTDAQDARDEFHRLADELRKASGQEVG